MATAMTASGGPAVAGSPASGGDVAPIRGVRLPCPQCGALLTPPHQVDTFACPWCGSTLQPAEGPRVFHLVERPRLDPTEAAQALRRWFAGPETPPGLEDEAVADVGDLHLFPFLRVRGQERERVLPLAPLPAADLWDLPLVPADMVAAPEASVGPGSSTAPEAPTARGWASEGRPVVRVQMDTDLLNDALAAASGDAAARELTVEERAYYPVSYRCGGERYTAVVCAGGGTVLARRRPARSHVVGERALAVGALALLFAEAAFMPGLAARFIAVGLTAAGLYPLILWLAATRL